MNIYKCVIRWRPYENFAGMSKIYWIEADSYATAYFVAEELSKDFTNVDYPDVTLYVPPVPEYSFTEEEAIVEFGKKNWEKIKKDISFKYYRDIDKRNAPVV